ncbi:hypothetical protein GOARA_064_00410 [Gordonia araii NBRC 100433]|uniref:Low molecular weight protein antigen 6 PH domain-containing protein n=1 Tax=Gordonia araii NBRC 100433 TaxID=1073574 RepID=G7H5B4_9ACTN|nr:PH domain-containing protein [Gordonia araii]NNG95754.1 PH domain-containing protein [Gordonia araii NBRC 100433]GAB11039.1 hypothetical protein GOARA_064_00410 [Gordonia araii NBRC 100433]
MSADADWDFVYRPRRLVIWSCVAAAVVLVIHATFAYLLPKSHLDLFGRTFTFGDNGVKNLGASDQWAIMLIGVVVAGAILLLTRPRLRVGRHGVGVRNLVGERQYRWDEFTGVVYPDRGSSAWLELPMDEHIPVLAIRIGDGEAAVEAMERVRELQRRYTESSAEHGS